ncbi:uncharacterized protein LOC131671725 [Phymastichus coffea]|uniref:uncharacterized protein LOC131671725 n=1 Tax=Phymastichus coffea TaxID=108790 RepID=UPI00273B8EA9|nr:uncharacterized protein LOC131671725 [Phymastichus coffea]
MRITTTIFAACLCVTIVNAWPLDSFRSRALDRLMMSETENDPGLRNKRTIGVLRQFFPDISKGIQDVAPEASETNQVVSEADATQSHQTAESQNNEVRVQFADETPSEAANEGELAPLDDVEAADDDNRNKRFLTFGGNGGGSGAGSGNFLFDIIRQAADGAARAAGTVYRVVAGTQSLGLGLSASRDIGPAPMMPAASGGMIPPPMMAPSAPMAPMAPMAPGATMPPGMMMGNGTMPAMVTGGSGSASSSDPAAGAPEPGPQQEAVPGPVTRLFVIANRGISNLIQDLILRLAATSERIVNFKARLITSII